MTEKGKKMELSSRIEGIFDLVNEVLKEVRDWRRELKELRLEIPIFEGHDVAGWIIKVEKYFNKGGVCKEEDQIPKLAQWMSGKAVTWYQLWILVNLTWGNFKEAILKKFWSEFDLAENRATQMREMRFSDEPNKRSPPQWFGQQPLLPKPRNVEYHMVIVVVPKIKSRKEKVPLLVSPTSLQTIMRKLTAVSRSDPGENYPISCITQSFCFKLWDPGGYILSP